MSLDFKIISVDDTNKTMVIDWGYITLNHDIPLFILENPEISQEEVIRHIGYMRPPVPVKAKIPSSLLSLVTEQGEDQYPAEEEIEL